MDRAPTAMVTTVAVERLAAARMPTGIGEFTAYGYRDTTTGEEHVALVMGDVASGEPVLARVHSECLTGEVFGSLRCDCRPQLDYAMERVAAEGRGVVVYMRGHEGRGIGIVQKLRAYALQDEGRDTVQANVELGLAIDARDYGAAAAILRDLGVHSVRLMTNNPLKISAMQELGMAVTERVPVVIEPTRENRRYLQTKKGTLGHLLDIND